MAKKSNKNNSKSQSKTYLKINGDSIRKSNEVELVVDGKTDLKFTKTSGSRVELIYHTSDGKPLRITPDNTNPYSATICFRGFNNGLNRGKISLQYVDENESDNEIIS